MKGVGMLIKRQVKTSFKSKLLILFLTAGLIPLIASAALYLRIISGMIMESSENASIENMKYVSFNIQRQMEAAEQLLGWITCLKVPEHVLPCWPGRRQWTRLPA